MVDEEVTLKNPSEAVEEVETLAEEFYNKPLILEKGKQFIPFVWNENYDLSNVRMNLAVVSNPKS